MPIAIESEATARVIEGYLVEHLFERRADVEADAPVLATYQPLRVGPFRFLCAVGDVSLEAPAAPAGFVIDAATLVPPAYRARLAGAAPGETTVWLDQGRIELRGCSLESVLALAAEAFVRREARADNPWIAGTVREPPAFLLDPAAVPGATASH